MTEYKLLGIDTSKSVFTLHGLDGADRVILRRDLRREGFVAFFAKLGPTDVVLEACGASHHWARQLSALGHRVRLIAPQYVKPFVARGKTDRADAAAICEAARRPSMRFVAVKSADRQAAWMVPRVRELLVKQRTQAINALRGHAAEFGVVAARGTVRVATVMARVREDAEIPAEAVAMLEVLAREVDRVDEQIGALDKRLTTAAKTRDEPRRLSFIPGVGPIGAMTFSLGVDASQFRSGRHFAAWLGLTPKEHSSGGRQRLGGISRAGNERMRSLLVLGATAVIRHMARRKASSPAGGSKIGGSTSGTLSWLLGLLERKPRKLVAVALANKMARIIWAMMARGEAYRGWDRPVAAVG